MAKTPDAADGPSLEEAVIWDEWASDPEKERRTQHVQGKGLVIMEDGVVRGIGESRVNIHQYPVDDQDVNIPPGTPTTGYRVIVGSSPEGVFVGHSGEIAQYNGASWVFSTPKKGTRLFVKDESLPYVQEASSSPWSWILNKANAVQIQGRSVHASVPDDWNILKWNNSESRWESGAGPQNGFGSWYKDEQEPGEIGTTSESWQDALILTFPIGLVEGDYLIQCCMIARGSSSSTRVGVRQLFDTTELCSIVIQATGTATQVPMSNFHVQRSISGSHTFALQYRKDGGAGTAYVKQRVAMGLRVD
ncbi:MAG: DUF2793 domain-containing protein [Deltaproteobacteria bacterium]|nr:DUF2793 domain-containing protein [Deltaproteobacteria bacterium]